MSVWVRRLLAAVTVVGLGVAVAYGARAYGVRPWQRGAAMDPPVGQDEYVVIPGQRACGVAVGETPAAVYARLGPPQLLGGYGRWWVYGRTRQVRTPYGGMRREIDPRGMLSILFSDPAAGTVEAVQCLRPSRWDLDTGGVVRLGTAVADAVRMVGAPQAIVFWDDDGWVTHSLLAYMSRGVVLVVESGRVVGMIVFRPRP
ncbi:MAG: hypothetical protein QN183_13740 [Armatimonadota bacterium]|nr:hypothetical protein [Armatimonadota bacterium]